jgi:hypothetical protein
MPIFQQGSLNTTALIVPDLYVQIVPPNQLLLNGVPTNVLGIVGTAPWGPVNQPTIAGSPAEYSQFFGPVMNRKYDIGTTLALATLQGAQFFDIVRVTDGTDTPSQAAVSAVDAIRPITIGGTPHVGDVLTLNVTPSGGVLTPVVYTMLGPDTTQTAALALAALVNASTYLAAQGVSADTALTGVFNLHYSGTAPVVTGGVTGGGATTTLTVQSANTLATTQATFLSLYTGTNGNNELVNISNGSQINSWRAVVSMPGFVPETFDNLGAGLKGNQIWQAIVSAINNGISGIRGPSQYLRAVVGAGASVPVVAQYALSGGTDGASNINTAIMLGVDTVPRTGMYAMRNQGISIGILSDVSDSTSWSTQVSFGLFEGIYMISVGPPSDTITNACGQTGTKAAAGIDSYAMKMIFGDWVYWFDTVNNLQRLVSPQGVLGGILSNLAPQNSSLNKQVYGLIGTQKSATGLTYTAADLQAIAGSGWDLIANPIPAGNMFGGRLGRNASSNAVIHGDNYTRMTNYIAATLNRGMGLFVGQLQSRRPNDKTRASAKATLDAFMQALLDQGMIDDFQNICDNSNNPATRIALGYMQADCQVVFLSVVEYFIINLQGGQSVQITRVSTNPVGAGTFAATPNPSLISAVNL